MVSKKPLLVQKFGGTSVGTPERIKNVAKRIEAARAQGYALVVVVSAMGDTTDDLIALAHAVSLNPPAREMDMLLTAGERVSMALVSMALTDLEVPAVSFTGSQSGIITDGAHRRARIKKILADRVRAELSLDKVVIVAGFQGVSENKEITTLGRGGSDTTAVALAAVLGAESCDIYTDVDGVMSADPRQVPEARLLKQVPHDLMIEMAHRGAGVLHPRCVELAKSYGVTIRVLSSLCPLGEEFARGTTIQKGVQKSKETSVEEAKLFGVTMDKSKALLKVELMRASAIGAIWDLAQEHHLSLLAPIWEGERVKLFIEKDSIPEWKKHLEPLSAQGFVKSYEIDQEQVPVSIVGERLSQDGAMLSRVLSALAQEGITAGMGVSSPLAMTVNVDQHKAGDAVRVLSRLLAPLMPSP